MKRTWSGWGERKEFDPEIVNYYGESPSQAKFGVRKLAPGILNSHSWSCCWSGLGLGRVKERGGGENAGTRAGSWRGKERRLTRVLPKPSSNHNPL